jgi:hypothetical protein
MKTERDEELRSRFERLRDEAGGQAPSYRSTLARARSRGDRRRPAVGAAWRIAVVAVIVAAVVVVAQVSGIRFGDRREADRFERVSALPTTWTVATDALRVTPGLRLTEPELLSWPRLEDPGAPLVAAPKPERSNS